MSLFDGEILTLIVLVSRRFFSAMIQYHFMRKLLPNRISHYRLIAISCVFTVWYILRDPALLGTSSHLWMNLFINGFTYFIIIFLFGGKFWRKLIVWWYFDIIKTMCEAVSYVPILLYCTSQGLNTNWAWITSSVESDVLFGFFHLSFFLPLFFLLCFLSLTIWRKILMDKIHPFYLLFITLPMGLRYSLTRVFRPSMGDGFLVILICFIPDINQCYDILSLFGISLGLVSSLAILYYVIYYNKRAEFEAELRQTKRAMELEQAKYSEIEERSEELVKIRHDFNNQLASVRRLVRMGDKVTAKELMDALSAEINNTENS